MCLFGQPQYSDSDSESNYSSADGVHGGDPRIYIGFEYSVMKPNEWCEHFMKHHLKDYESGKRCPKKRCNFHYKLFHEGVIHYRTVHGLFNCVCRSCRMRFPSLTAGREHEKIGCGDFMICGACDKVFYNREEIDFHKQPNNCSRGTGYEGYNDDFNFECDRMVRINNDDE